MPTVRASHYKLILIAAVILGAAYGGYRLYLNSTGALMSQARRAFANQDRETSRQLVEKILERRPDHLDALFMLSQIVFESKDYSETERILRQILSRAAESRQARRSLAEVYLAQCRFKEALKETERVAAGGSLSVEDRGQQALALAGLSVGATEPQPLLTQASRLAAQTLQESPDQGEARLANAVLQLDRGDYGQALGDARVAQHQLGGWFAVQWALGKALYYTGDVQGAMEALENADQQRRMGRGIAPPPRWTMELYLHQGLVYVDRGELGEAERRFSIAQENDPTAAEPTFARVNGQLMQARTAEVFSSGEDAIRMFRLASDALSRRTDLLEANPNQRFQLALIEIYLQNHKKALQLLESLAEAEPPHIQALQELGNLYDREANYSQAARVYRRILSYAPDSMTANYNLGTILLRNREVDPGRDCLRSVVEKMPDWIEARLNLGLACRLGGRYEEASRDYEVILAKSPENMDALIGLGLIASAQGDAQTASRYFTQARDLHPDRSEPFYYLGQISLEEGRTAEAQSLLERCLSLDPENEFAVMSMVEIQFQREAWGPAKERLLAILQNPNARTRVSAGNAVALAELMTGNLQEARQRLAKLEEILPGLEPELVAAVRTNQAILAFKENRTEEALELAKSAVNAQPNESATHYNLGTLQLQAGRPSEAVLSFRKAAELDPDHEATQYNLAVAQGLQNRWEESLRILERLAHQEDASLEVLRNLAEAYIGSGDPGAALELLEPAVGKHPAEVGLQTVRVKAFIASGEIEKARQLAAELAKNFPQDWAVHMVCGISEFLGGDPKAGETHLRRALQIDGENPSLKLNLAVFLIAKGDYDGLSEAERLLGEIEGKVTATAVYNQRALLAFRRSDFTKARSFLQRSLMVDENQPKISALLSRIEEL